MADEYIRRRDAIIKMMDNNIDHAQGTDGREVVQILSDIPVADVAPVVHSYWEGEETDCNIKCHKCEKAFKDYIITQDYVDLNEYPNFCPNCGAKMDGENKDE